MVTVLFVCTGNMYRSPIAAEIFRGILLREGKQDHWQVGSAGTWTTAGRPVPNDALQIARSLGIDLDAHRTRMVDQKMLEEASLILVMEEGQQEALQVEFPFAQKKTHLLSQVMHGFAYDIPDPASARGEARIILQEMADMIEAGYANIYKLAE